MTRQYYVVINDTSPIRTILISFNMAGVWYGTSPWDQSSSGIGAVDPTAYVGEYSMTLNAESDYQENGEEKFVKNYMHFWELPQAAPLEVMN